MMLLYCMLLAKIIISTTSIACSCLSLSRYYVRRKITTAQPKKENYAQPFLFHFYFSFFFRSLPFLIAFDDESSRYVCGDAEFISCICYHRGRGVRVYRCVIITHLLCTYHTRKIFFYHRNGKVDR
jgi:hypothetical protein